MLWNVAKIWIWKDRHCVFIQEKIMGVDYCEEYIKQNIFTAVLRKGNAYPVDICILIKN